MVHRRLTGLLLALTLLLVPAGAGAQEEQPQFDLKSEAAVLMDAASGQVFFAKNADERRAPASTTKIMTLVLAFEALREGRISMDDVVVGSEAAKSLGGSTIFLDAGEEMKLEDIIKGVAISSGNDASLALAEHISGSESEFTRLMNEKAAALGMKNTNFVNSHGLPDENHYTSAMDLAVLSRYAVQEYPEMLEYTRIYDGGYLREGQKNEFRLFNTNKLVRFYSGADGIKTGSTSEAGFCVAATARRGETRFIAVIMGAPDSSTRNAEATQLLNYAFSNFESVPVAKKGDIIGEPVRVFKGKVDTVDAVAPSDFGVTVRKGQGAQLKRVAELKENLLAPVEAGDVVGSLKIQTEDGQTLGEIELVAGRSVRRANVLDLFLKTFTSLFPF